MSRRFLRDLHCDDPGLFPLAAGHDDRSEAPAGGAGHAAAVGAIEAALAPKLARQALPTQRAQGQDLLGSFEVEFGGGVSPAGRPRLPVRLMASLLYLKNSST